jgi:chloride channel protein, CIC family
MTAQDLPNLRNKFLIQIASALNHRGIGARLRAFVRGNELFLIPVALVIGAAVGAIVTAMSEAAQLAHVAIYGIPLDIRLSANSTVNPVAALLGPVIGGLILGAMEWSRLRWGLSAAVDPIEANALRGGQLSVRDSIVVSGQTLISNGCGASVGLEAGYTQIGAGSASWIGRLLKLRRNDQRLIVGCGAAAAIASAFGAPLTGAFYACELIVGIYSIAGAAPILVASIAATLTAQVLGGAPYYLEIPQTGPVASEQYPSLILLALLVSGIGILIMKSATIVELMFHRLVKPVWLRPAFGGLCVGGLAIVTPQVLAAGHGAMLLDLHRDMTLPLILLILCMKVAACLISLGSGFRGGLFFASLFLGCLLGKAFAALSPLLSLGLTLDPTICMLTGMAVLGVAIIGGPLTMSFLVLETTRNLEVSAGVLAACIVASVFVRAIFGHSFSTWRLHLRGETIRSANDVGWMRMLTVARMMRTDLQMVFAGTSIADCRRLFPLGSRRAIIAIDTQERYVGVVMLSELFSSDADNNSDRVPIANLAKQQSAFLHPNMNIKSAIACFDQAEAEILAVVESVSNPRVLGTLSESYAMKRYTEELAQATRSVLGAL